MHASCTICGDVFTGVHPEIIHSTNCGHIFHYDCLVQWLQRSKTCPHCRHAVNERNTVRLYLQLSAGETQDTGLLENKIQSLSFQLAIRNSDFKKLTDETKQYQEQNKYLRQSVLKAEEQARSHETVVNSLHEQLRVMKSQVKELKGIQSKVQEMEAKIEQYKSMEKIINGSITDAEESLDLMKNIADTTTLCACISALKSEVCVLTEKSGDLLSNLKAKESKITQMNRDMLILQDQLSISLRSLDKIKEDLSILKAENLSLREKYNNLRNTIRTTNPTDGNPNALNDTFVNHTLPVESPSPLLSRRLLDVEDLIHVTSTNDNVTPTNIKIKFLSAGEKSNKLLLNRPRLPKCRSFSSVTNDIPDGLGGYGTTDGLNGRGDDTLSLHKIKQSLKPPPPKKNKIISNAESGKNSISNFFVKRDAN